MAGILAWCVEENKTPMATFIITVLLLAYIGAGVSAAAPEPWLVALASAGLVAAAVVGIGAHLGRQARRNRF